MVTRQARSAAENILVIGGVLAAAYGMKSYYSTASPDDLLWILTPTTILVSLFTGLGFEFETGRGFLSRDSLFEIVPSCAGLNFMIIAFSAIALGLTHKRRGVFNKCAMVLASAVIAIIVTIAANATRITLAIPLHKSHVSIGALTPERLHLCVGAVVYLIFLCATFALIAWSVDRRIRLELMAIPLTAYLGVALLVPLFRGAGGSGAFWEYAVITALIVGLFAVLFAGIRMLRSRPCKPDPSTLR